MSKEYSWKLPTENGEKEVTCEADGNKYHIYLGDAFIKTVFKNMSGNADVELTIAGVPCRFVAFSDVPDLVPILSVAAAVAEGKSRFFGVSRLRAKESDRLRAVIDMLASLGVHAESDGEILTVEGRGRLTGGCVDAYGDHRLAMSAAVAAVRAREKVDIIGAESVSKSYPAFFEDYESLATLAEN